MATISAVEAHSCAVSLNSFQFTASTQIPMGTRAGIGPA
jgi:hypothetical protein